MLVMHWTFSRRGWLFGMGVMGFGYRDGRMADKL
jgi:hypothetical protein